MWDLWRTRGTKVLFNNAVIDKFIIAWMLDKLNTVEHGYNVTKGTEYIMLL
jgi:hypothetical protein